jgi:hypothetical protein
LGQNPLALGPATLALGFFGAPSFYFLRATPFGFSRAVCARGFG